jgi:hypothetical protein|tara:strand:+ start:811 stop:1056 length:246 start_codon:yes stop_codon:yes gene_type:complete
MTIDVDSLSDLWITVKEYIPSKDRQTAADHVVSVVADSGLSEDDLKAFGGTDAYLTRAVRDVLGEEEVPEEEDDVYGSDDY